MSVLSKSLADEYEDVRFVMWYEKPIFYNIDSRIKLVSIEKLCQSKSFIPKAISFRAYIEREKPNILLAFGAPFSMIALLTLIDKKVPIIAAERIDPGKFVWGKILMKVRDYIYKNASGILVQTESGRSYFKGKSYYDDVEVISNPIFMSNMLVGSALETVKEDVVISVARLESQKNQSFLIKTFVKFHQTHPTYRLVIYGEGSKRQELEKLIESLNAFEYIKLPGISKDIWNQMKRAKLFVLTSNYEGMSNSMMEAMCLGLPCVSTKVSGAIDLIVNGENGVLIDNNDEEGLINALSHIVDNTIFANQLGETSSKIYEDLNVDKVITQWMNYINKKIRK